MGVVAPATPAPDSGPPAEELAQPNVEDTELSNKITQLKVLNPFSDYLKIE